MNLIYYEYILIYKKRLTGMQIMQKRLTKTINCNLILSQILNVNWYHLNWYHLNIFLYKRNWECSYFSLIKFDFQKNDD